MNIGRRARPRAPHLALRHVPECQRTPEAAVSTILDIESINWTAVSDAVPDADTTVLVYAPDADDPVWLGFYDGVFWFAVTGDGYGDPDEIAAEVTAWATMPAGPS